MFTFIYPYRNRDLERLKNSLDSLKNQTDSDFEVFFVDYGSEGKIKKMVELLCGEFDFVTYKFYSTQFQPWNKSKALNSIIKNLNTDFCFIADVDMIFHPQFLEKSRKLQVKDKTVYFQVGFLEPEKSSENKEFGDYKNFRKSTSEATGLSMFPVKVLKEVHGFDEFYHFWGAEDTDMHVRIKNAGYQLEFYTEEVLMLHQWHPSYRSKESAELTSDLQLGGIVALNHQHMKSAMYNKTTMVNPNYWGEIMSETQYKELQEAQVDLELANEKRSIDDLLYGQLASMNNRVFKIRINQSSVPNSLRDKTKRLLNKKILPYYSLKEVNDLLLLHLISFYRDRPYYYKVIDSGKIIEFAIKL